MLRQISLAKLGLIVGVSLTLMGIVTYALGNATLNLIGLFYGVPVLLGGLALKAAELKPIPFRTLTSPAILTLREQQATSTQDQIRNDITRYRYGQQAHLDESLERLGLSPTDEERPVLRFLEEAEIDNAYALILTFESPFVSLEVWQKRREKIERFFGPGIRVELKQSQENWVDVALIRSAESGEEEETEPEL